MTENLSYDMVFVEVPRFKRDVRKIMTEEELEAVKSELAVAPKLGDPIPYGDGIRKLRWSLGNRGKSHGARIIYFYRDKDMPLYLLAVYKKSQKINLRASETKELVKLIKELEEAHTADAAINE